ncbi:type II toxin-antitoxin system RelE/ParE family toxin [Rickettsiales bacterium]|nr:type II toxin-antitoxin system RelE/ParE family toxin [Rickettsiales bacterium]
MIYKITFLEDALKEWKKLPEDLKKRFKSKLSERMKEPRVKSSALHGMRDCYKIKFRAIGYRLVYKVYDDRLVIQIVAVGKRDKNIVYKRAKDRV